MRRIIGFVTMFFLAVTVVFGKSQENVIDITFNKLRRCGRSFPSNQPDARVSPP